MKVDGLCNIDPAVWVSVAAVSVGLESVSGVRRNTNCVRVHELWYGMDEPERYYEHACDKVECKITFNYQGNSPNLYRSKLCFHSKGNSETRFKSELKKFFEHYG